MLKHVVVFSADLHGNELQYRKLVDYATKVSADSVIIGGDIAPNYFRAGSLVRGQRHFLDKRLPKIIHGMKTKNPDRRVFLMMGNDDCAANLDVLEKEDPSLFRVIHEKRVKLTEEFDIVGYPYVPITPFSLKDWEKYDFSKVPNDLASDYVRRKILNYRLYGFKSKLNYFEKFRFSETMEEEDSIQKDLEKDVFTANPERTVYVIHTPPNRTHLDQRYDGYHLGSFAVRSFIERHQPLLTLHGHIHETVAVSGDFKETIGNSLSLSAGNHNFQSYTLNELSVLIFDLYDLKTVKRTII